MVEEGGIKRKEVSVTIQSLEGPGWGHGMKRDILEKNLSKWEGEALLKIMSICPS